MLYLQLSEAREVYDRAVALIDAHFNDDETNSETAGNQVRPSVLVLFSLMDEIEKQCSTVAVGCTCAVLLRRNDWRVLVALRLQLATTVACSMGRE